MNFRFNDEQRMLATAATAFLAEVADSPQNRTAMQSDLGFDPRVWSRLCAEMFWQGILVPETDGGLELGFVELLIVLEKAGERLHPSPLLAVAASTAALRLLPESSVRSALLARIAEGGIVSLAHTTAYPDWFGHRIEIRASETDEGFSLSGDARFIPFGHAAETLLVVANLEHGLGLFALPSDCEGLTCERTATMDQSRAMASLRLTNVAVPREACLHNDFDNLLPQVIDVVRILTGADQVGCAQASLDISVDYVKQRVQFGKAIGSFQAVKHKAADMMLKVESARSLLYYAACVANDWLTGQASAQDLAEAAGMLASCAGDAAFFNAGTGIQLHGGVGITEEYDIQLYFKRARSTENYLGSPAEMREQIAQHLLDGD